MTTVSSGVKRPFDVFRNDVGFARHSYPFASTASSRATSIERSLSRHPSESPVSHSDLPSRPATPSLYKESHRSQSLRAPRTFSPSASLLILGIRGTGKSSLAVIASNALQRPIIDADDYFLRYCGTSRTGYRQQHGPTKYAAQEVRVMRELFAQHGTGYIIVCGPSGTLEGSGGSLFKDFAQSHPVIYLVRDALSITRYLKIQDSGKIEHLLEVCGPAYRSSSNFEFFNISETASRHRHSVSSKTSLDVVRDAPETPFLTLKDVEYDFVRLLRHVTRGGLLCRNPDATSPFTSISLPTRDFTYAVSVPFSRLEEGDFDIEDVAIGADAFEISILSLKSNSNCHFSISRLLDRVSHQYARVRRHSVVPIIYHADVDLLRQLTANLESPNDARNTYLDLLHHGLRLGAEYLTVDLSLDDAQIHELAAVKGWTKVIGHSHHPHSQNLDWDGPLPLQLHQRAQTLGCDIVRLSKPASTLQDNFGVQRFLERVKSRGQSQENIPIIAYNTGSIGRMSCCFNSLLSPVTHLSLRAGPVPRAPNAASMITVAEAQEALFKTFFQDKLHFYIFGGAIQHSLSPAMHNAAFKACGMLHDYTIRQHSSIQALAHLLENEDFGGCSIGLPFKMEAMSLVKTLSPSARAIGAVNTIVPVRDDVPPVVSLSELSLYHGRNRAGPVRQLLGYNTDWVGIINSIREGLSPVNAVGPRTTGLVAGAGGMARASIYALIQMGIRQVFIYNRTVKTAEDIAEHFEKQDPETLLTGFDGSTPSHAGKVSITVLRSTSEPWPAGYRQPTVMVSTVPSASPPGMPPPNFTLPEQWLQSPTGGVVLELAYKPLVTPLMRQMRAVHNYSRGWVFLDGLEVLPQQGFPQFELFTGRRAPRRLMKAEVLRAYQASQGGEDDEAGISQRLEDIESPAVSG